MIRPMPSHADSAFRSPLALLVLGVVAAIAESAAAAQTPTKQDQAAAELEQELAVERHEADRLRRHGETSKASKSLSEMLSDDPRDARARILRARVRADEADWDAALADGAKALADGITPGGPDASAWLAAGVRGQAAVHLTLGRAADARALLAQHEQVVAPESDSRDAWIVARTALALGARERWRATLETGAAADCGDD
ncbi:MAG TPA: hypothetical protein VM509_14025, partial [Planctomycetota bacterium]|nr:hypothetical protein [Planctomycetota bacterium]